MKCPRCGGTVVSEIQNYNGEKILDVHCIHCGERFYSEEIYQRQIKSQIQEKRD